MRRRITAKILMFLCAFGLVWGGERHTVLAEAATEAPVETFSGDVAMLKQEEDRYVMQVTVENSGEDFAGTVQVIFGEAYDNCAYQTEITLPAQGKKQFTITVPERAMDTVYGLCRLDFLDREGKSVQAIQIRDVLGSTMSGIPVGILSDNYSGLTFMDAGGETFYIRGIEKPMELVELDNNNLTGYLDGLYFLIIDQFNVSSLSEENIQAIQDWVYNGGWLIIGTGAYAEQTLSGFDESFLDVEVVNVSEPGEDNQAAVNADQYGYYSNYRYADVDFTQMAMAELNYNPTQSSTAFVTGNMDQPAIVSQIGDGSVALFFFSLGEKELQKISAYMIQDIYQELMFNSNSYQALRNSNDMEYLGQRALSFMDSLNSTVDFSGLRVLILIYVVLVGPVLYLILRKCKKREWYWVGVPALGILFIAGVYFFGRSIRVNETKAYSVTVQQADSNQADTYLLAYHSGVKPWMVHLKDNYEIAGPGFQGYGNYYYVSSGIDDYHYLVRGDSGDLSVGLKPRENFENGFLYAGGRAESRGTLTGQNLTGHGLGNISGIITNETGCDLAYMAVWFDSYITVFSDVTAGETIDIQQADRDGRVVYQDSVPYYDNLLHSMVGIYGIDQDYRQDDMAALFIGLGVAENKRPQSGKTAVIAGVVKDYDKVITDKCNEISYGCLYSYTQYGSRDAGDTEQAGPWR